jgi:hypothetical protein
MENPTHKVKVLKLRKERHSPSYTDNNFHHDEIYEGDSKSKGKIHVTAVIQITVSNFTYSFST